MLQIANWKLDPQDQSIETQDHCYWKVSHQILGDVQLLKTCGQHNF